MAAIVRVKRRRDEDPADSLLIACKKCKPNEQDTVSLDSSAEEVKCQAKFVGTVSEKATSVTTQVRDAIRQEKLQKEYQRQNAYLAPVASNGKSHTEHAANHLGGKNRYRVVAQKRALKFENLDEEHKDESGPSREKICRDEKNAGDGGTFHLYDVIPEKPAAESEPGDQVQLQNPQPSKETVTCNGVPMVRERVQPPSCASNVRETDEYVYDIYYLNSQNIDFRTLQDILFIEACRGELEYGEYRNEDHEVYDEEDDSNDESNWRNDYPEEDPHIYDNEVVDYGFADSLVQGFNGDDDLNFGMDHLRLDDQYVNGDLSSDEEDTEVYKQSRHRDAANGPWSSYDRYLARVRREMGDDGDDENESDENT